MPIAVITGSSGLIGSEASLFFHSKGMEVIGIDNNMREYFFGNQGSTQWKREELEKNLGLYRHFDTDIRNQEALNKIFSRYGKDIQVVIHTAAQPSHDWSYGEPHTDFFVNAVGTLNLIEAVRIHCPEAVFIFTSTNKVYGDRPNSFPLVELPKRYEIESSHPYYHYGYDENLSIDQCKHSVFGASKVAADVMVQEYIRHFKIRGGIFRGGCLTGPAHSSVEIHGFLSYLVNCAVANKRYTIYGYKGKQVRDNIHSYDLVNAFWHFFQNPEKDNPVYNLGGGREINCSILEAIDIIEEFTGERMNTDYSETHRIGDPIWLIGDIRKFQNDFPEWKFQYDLKSMIKEMIEDFKTRSLIYRKD